MSTINQSIEFDTIIIGAGILGLWAAHYIINEGRSVCVIDKGKIGAGASGGILGALMGHIPDGWNMKKEFQFHALDTLGEKLDQLGRQSNMNIDYRRCGRVMPLSHEGMIDHVDNWILGAKTNWRGRYDMKYLEPGNEWFAKTGWPVATTAPYGASFDSFAARINPRKVIAALGIFVKKHGQLRENITVATIHPEKSEIVLADGSKMKAGEIIVANGVDAYRLLHPLMGPINANKPLGRGVRGQAVLVEYPHIDDLPILYQDGCYIVPQANNRMAIGSTSHNMKPGELELLTNKPLQFDENDVEFYQTAMMLAPMLRDAPIVEKWAGIRPRNTLEGRGADAWFEPMPGYKNLIALIGGFKITFGIAHRAMDVARGKIAGPRRKKKLS